MKIRKICLFELTIILATFFRESVGKSGRIDPDSVDRIALLNDRICVRDVDSADGAASLRSLRTS